MKFKLKRKKVIKTVWLVASFLVGASMILAMTYRGY